MVPVIPQEYTRFFPGILTKAGKKTSTCLIINFEGSDMKICVLNSGSVQPILRTLAAAKYADIIEFIEIGSESKNHLLLKNAGIKVTFHQAHVFRLRRYLQHVTADVYVCHYASGIHVRACLLAGKTPLVAIAMGGDILHNEQDRQRTALERLLVRRAVKKADFIYAKSGYILKRLNKWGILDNVDVNYWGADLNRFVPGNREIFKKKLTRGKDKKIILSTRMFSPNYNIDLIARVSCNIARNNPEVEMIFMGKHSNKDYYDRVNRIIDEAGLSDRATFIPEVGINEITDYYQAADVAVSLARSEGFPNSVLEMMAVKTPMIVGKIPQIEELLRDGENALLCDLNGESLEQKLRWALDEKNAPEIQRITENAFQTVKKYGDLDRNAHRFVQEIKKLNSRRKIFPIDLLFLTFMNMLLSKVRKLFRGKRK
jgi:glycosyltransferase involved in cell wall biosynthesis